VGRGDGGAEGDGGNGFVGALGKLVSGGAGTPNRGERAEAGWRGQPWRQASFQAAAAALGSDFTPLSDWRASADYRLTVARNLLQRFFLSHDDQTAEPVDLLTA